MLAMVLLCLVACQSAASLKFRKVNENHDRRIDDFNTESDIHKMDILNRKKENIIRREGNLNNEIMNINRQQEDLNREMVNIKKQKDSLQIKSEFLTRQKKQLEREMDKLNSDIKRINGQGGNHASAVVEGNEFKITIDLSGYNEEDIVVKSKKRLLIIEAIHSVPGEPKINYFNVRSLPDFVKSSGRWFYMWGVLKIVFPIVQHQNIYPKLTIPLSNEKLHQAKIEKDNGKPNIDYQNPAKDIIKGFSVNSATTNRTKNTEVPSQNNEIKTYVDKVSNQ